jgi:hypothetical protein
MAQLMDYLEGRNHQRMRVGMQIEDVIFWPVGVRTKAYI